MKRNEMKEKENQRNLLDILKMHNLIFSSKLFLLSCIRYYHVLLSSLVPKTSLRANLYYKPRFTCFHGTMKSERSHNKLTICYLPIHGREDSTIAKKDIAHTIYPWHGAYWIRYFRNGSAYFLNCKRFRSFTGYSRKGVLFPRIGIFLFTHGCGNSGRHHSSGQDLANRIGNCVRSIFRYFPALFFYYYSVVFSHKWHRVGVFRLYDQSRCNKYFHA